MYRPEFDPNKSGDISAGIDVIEIRRIAQSLEEFGERFLVKVFTEQERERYGKRPNELAVRFAAKEATSKVLGTGIRGIRWKEMEIMPNSFGKPVLILHGSAAERAERLGLHDFSVSLTHSKTEAIAIVIGIKGFRDPAADQAAHRE